MTTLILADIAISGNVSWTYYNGTNNDGIGATFTDPNAEATTMGGVAQTVGQRILYINNGAPQHTGLYVVTTAGTSLVSGVWTRTTDYNTPAAVDSNSGILIHVTGGDYFSGTYWFQSAFVATVGLADLVFVQQASFIQDNMVVTTDNTTSNVSTTAHGFAPKAPNDATKYLDGTGAYTVPASSAVNLTGPITSVGAATSIASQTGTGTKFVMDTSPTLVTPALGTPASGNLVNCTGFPAAGATVLIGHVTASNQATVDFTSLSLSGYSHLTLVATSIIPVTDNVQLYLRFSTGGTFDGGTNYLVNDFRFTNTASGIDGNGSLTAIPLTGVNEVLGTAANATVNTKVTIYEPAGATYKYLNGEWCGRMHSGTFLSGITGAYWANTGAIDGVRILCASGNISSGKFALYGVKNS